MMIRDAKEKDIPRILKLLEQVPVSYTHLAKRGFSIHDRYSAQPIRSPPEACTLRRRASVSYTHLDVYKRQVFSSHLSEAPASFSRRRLTCTSMVRLSP